MLAHLPGFPALHRWINRHPRAYRLYLRGLRRQHLHLLVQRDTELVIEGYPRCGNSYAVVAFERAQGSPVRLAHHTHSPTQIILAARWGIPCLLLLRPPEDAVLSLLIRDPRYNANQALRTYLSFHRPLPGLGAHFVSCDFSTLTGDFGRVITGINQRFGTRFAGYRTSPEADREVFATLEQLEPDAQGGTAEARVSRPSAEREAIKARRREELASPRNQALLTQAQALYRQLRSGAV